MSARALSELGPRDLQGWAELAESAAEPNPFLHPDFVRLAAEALRPRGLRILHCENAGGWTACLPVVPVLARRDVLGPGLACWRHEHCFLGTPLVAAGAVEEGVRGLLDGVRAQRTAGYLALDWMRAGGPVSDAVAALAPPPVGGDRFDRAFVTRPAPGDRAMSALSSGRAKRLRRQQRRLEEAIGAPCETVERRDTAAAVATFLELESSGWKGREGTAMASRPGHGAFLTAVCEAFARRDAVQLLSLEGNGRVASMQCNLRAGPGLFCMKVAYDETLAELSPGTQLEVAALELFEQDERTAWMDSCAAPDAELINRLWPERTTITTFLVPTGAASAITVRWGSAALRVARRARSRALED